MPTSELTNLASHHPAVRYWFYLTAVSGVSYNLEAMETDLRCLLGAVEDSPFVTQERDTTA